MKRALLAFFCLSLAACSEQQKAGTGVINSQPVEFMVREYIPDGLFLDGWQLFVNGENLGVLLHDGKPTGPRLNPTQEFLPLKTKYGEFDMRLVRNGTFAGVTDIFTITLDGTYVGTVSGEL